MTATVVFDLNALQQWAKRLGAAEEEIPWAMSGLLNDGGFATRQVFIQSTWPRSIIQRNASFMSATLRVDKADKNNLQVSVYETLGRAHLRKHAEGGTKVPKGRHLAIPLPGSVQLSASGVRADQRPQQLIARTPKNRLRIDDKGIWVLDGPKKGGKWRLRYVFKTSAQIKRDVPFEDDFRNVMTETVRTGFADAMARAMSGRSGIARGYVK